LSHAYRISDENGSRNIHQRKKYQHSEECVRGPDGKDPPITSTNRDWVHTGKKSTITLRCHVCAEKPYKVW